jgi:hypothetical protein
MLLKKFANLGTKLFGANDKQQVQPATGADSQHGLQCGSPEDIPGTSVIFGIFRAHGGKIAEENRLRSPGRCACR